MKHQQRRRLALVRDDRSEPAEAPADVGGDRGPEVGQIRTAHADRGSELRVLVVEAHTEHVEAMLCGEDCEWATDTDSVLEPSSTGLPHRLLVHGDVSGSILKRRLGPALGQIGSHLVDQIALRGRGLDFTSSDLGRGRTISGETDPRWAWKLDKHRQMRQVRARASELGWEIYKLGPREE